MNNPRTYQEWRQRLEPLAQASPKEVLLFAARVAWRLLPFTVGRNGEFKFDKPHETSALNLCRAAWVGYKAGVSPDDDLSRAALGVDSRAALDVAAEVAAAAWTEAEVAVADANAVHFPGDANIVSRSSVIGSAVAAVTNVAFAVGAGSFARSAQALTAAKGGYQDAYEAAYYADVRAKATLFDLERLEKDFSLQLQPLWPKVTDSIASCIQEFSAALNKNDLAMFASDYHQLVYADATDISKEPWGKYGKGWAEEITALGSGGDGKAKREGEGQDEGAPARDGNESISPAEKKLLHKPSPSLLMESVSQEDHLNREEIISAAAVWLKEKSNSGHVALGLFGDWGAGKSTFVELLRQRLGLNSPSKVHWPFWGWWRRLHDMGIPQNIIAQRNQSPVRFVSGEFNAWLYEHSTSTYAGIAQEAVTALTQDLTFFGKAWLTLRYALREHFWRVFSLLAVLALPFVTVAVAPQLASSAATPEILQLLFKEHKSWLVGGEVLALLLLLFSQYKTVLGHPLAKELKTYFRLPDFEAEMGAVPLLRRKLEVLTELRLKPSRFNVFRRKPLRMLFVIDDLDRCSAAGVVKVLEAARLLMHIDNVVVLIAIDQKIALASLAQHYDKISKHMSNNPPLVIARDYLGKVVHMPITLEEPSIGDVHGFLEGNLWADDDDLPDGFEFEPENSASPTAEGAAPADAEEGASVLADEQAEVYEAEITDKQVPEADEVTPDINFKRIELTRLQGLNPLQKAIFKHWVQVLNLRNPRQLKRLNNAYALIRLRYRADEDEELAVERLAEKKGQHPRLVMLLWLEYVNSLPIARRNPILQAILTSGDDGGGNKIGRQGDRDLWEAVSEALGDADYQRIYNQVKNFVLPAV